MNIHLVIQSLNSLEIKKKSYITRLMNFVVYFPIHNTREITTCNHRYMLEMDRTTAEVA